MYHSVRKSTKYQTLVFLLASSFFICVPQCEEESQVSDSDVGYGILGSSCVEGPSQQTQEVAQVTTARLHDDAYSGRR